MKKKFLFLSIFLITVLFFSSGSKAVMAGPHLSFSPSTGAYKVGQEFDVTVKMESGGIVIPGNDGVGTYDSTRLELIKIEKSSSLVFDEEGTPGSCDINDSVAGKFSFSCYSTLDSNSNSGNVVVFSFKAKAVGTARVDFGCTSGSTTDTNIWNESVNDVIVCSENVNGSYVITAADSTTDDSDDSDDSDDTEEETTTSELPKTGSFGATVGLILFGVVSVASAVFLKFL